MKRVLIFIGLKIAEIISGFVVFAILSFGHHAIANTAFGAWMSVEGKWWFEPTLGFWANGWVGIVTVVIIIMGLAVAAIPIMAIVGLVMKNWEWSGKIKGGE